MDSIINFPDEIICGVKYNKAQLSTLSDGTKQMSGEWIEPRLFKSVGDLKDNITSYDKLLIRVMPDGSIKTKQLP